MHAFVVCLAVLAAGVGAALLSWVARRLIARLQPAMNTAAPVLRDAVDRFLIGPPAPDLSRLCVLRV
jgi:cell division protein FtsX